MRPKAAFLLGTPFFIIFFVDIIKILKRCLPCSAKSEVRLASLLKGKTMHTNLNVVEETIVGSTNLNVVEETIVCTNLNVVEETIVGRTTLIN